jgi:hypothetical protein
VVVLGRRVMVIGVGVVGGEFGGRVPVVAEEGGA